MQVFIKDHIWISYGTSAGLMLLAIRAYNPAKWLCLHLCVMVPRTGQLFITIFLDHWTFPCDFYKFEFFYVYNIK